MKNKKSLFIAAGLFGFAFYKYMALSRKEKNELFFRARNFCKNLVGNFLPADDECIFGKSEPAAYSPDFGNETP